MISGYGLHSDLKMLLKSFPCMSEELFNLKRVVDLEQLAKQVVKKFFMMCIVYFSFG